MDDQFLFDKNAYLTFDGRSIRDLIIERLNRGGVFTDQNYQGSNLSAIIDVVGYTFSTLLYYLNKTSSESMFSESQIYENMNRIVKILGYNPIGQITANVPYNLTISNLNKGNYAIPRFSYLNVGGTTFSTVEDVSFTKTTDGGVESITNQNNLLYQGIFEEYPSYSAVGVDNEVIYIAVDDTVSIDYFNFHVYVKRNGETKWIKWERTQDMFLNVPNDTVYSVRLNENKRYEISFGNDINGVKLNTGDQVQIYYLRIDINNTGIGPNTLDNNNLVLFNSINYSSILNDTKSVDSTYLSNNQLNNINLTNDFPSTVPSDYESVESIRNNAPKGFRGQYRLLTNTDFESYIKTNYSDYVSDVKVFNNEDYLKNHIKYLYDIGLSSPQLDNRVLINQINFSSSCNFNNIYIYCVPKNQSVDYLSVANKERMLDDMNEFKVLTSEIVLVDPIYMLFDFYLKTNDEELVTDNLQNAKLQITKKNNTRRTNSAILSDVQKVFTDYFSKTNLTLGQLINTSQINADILNIDGVELIKTVRTDKNVSVDGVSFLVWNSVYTKEDINVYSQNIQLQDFQYAQFNDIANIVNRIEVLEPTGTIKVAEF
jgi:hypothetical protein